MGTELKRNHASPDNTLARSPRESYQAPPVSARAYALFSARQYANNNGSSVSFLPVPAPPTLRKDNPQMQSKVFSPALPQECLGAVPAVKRDLHQQSSPQEEKPPSRGVSAAKKQLLTSNVFSSAPEEPRRPGKRISSACQSPIGRVVRKRSPPSGVSPSLLSSAFS